MKIHQVRFKNLNSLVGEWEIDLTHPAYSSEGLFAITGPTGAGKSTVLDAICLALYGSTPRLGKLSKSNNEIMSRQSGDCFAEVVFSTPKGHFRCHWSQHRSRNRPGAELQQPKQELADAHSGQILETKLKDVAERVEAVTGMDFERFTRSMLLAQGGFAAFLQAGGDERAPILEQITGTEIYSLISKAVHERNSEEKKCLELLQSGIAGIQALSPEEEIQLTQNLSLKEGEEKKLSASMVIQQEAITWQEGLEKIKQELSQLAQQQIVLQTKQEAFIPERLRLSRAQRALELSGDYAHLCAIRQEQKNDQQQRLLEHERLPQHREQAQQRDVAFKAAEEMLRQRKNEFQAALPLLRKVRDYDVKIQEKDLPIQSEKLRFNTLHQRLQQLNEAQQQDSTSIVQHQQKLSELKGLMENTSADAALVEQLTGLKSRFEGTQKLATTLQNLHIALELAQAKHLLAVKTSQKLSLTLAKAKQSLQNSSEASSAKRHELETLLEGRELSDWRNEQMHVGEYRSNIAKVQEAEQLRKSSTQTLLKLQQHQAKCEETKKQCLAEGITFNERHRVLEKECELLETQWALIQRIEDLEETRKRLKDHEACPLCGSLDHPFVSGHLPMTQDTQDQLQRVKDELKVLREEQTKSQIVLAKTEKDVEQTLRDIQEHSQVISKATQSIQQYHASFEPQPQWDPSNTELASILKDLDLDGEQQQNRIKSLVSRAEAIEKEIIQLQKQLDKERETSNVLEREHQAALHQEASESQALERSQNEVETCSQNLATALENCRQEISVWGISELSTDQLESTYIQLSQRRDRWMARNQEYTKLGSELAALKPQLKQRAEQITSNESELTEVKQGIDRLLTEQQELRQERKALFGDQSPDQEESRRIKAVEEANSAVDEARNKANEAQLALQQLNSRLLELDKNIAKREERLVATQKAFEHRLMSAEFEHESSYLSACLNTSEREELRQRDRALSEEQGTLQAQTIDKQTQLNMEQSKNLSEAPLEELKLKGEELRTILQQQQQDIGGLRQKIRDNQELKQRQQHQLLALEKQKKECVRWKMLHDLIGSSDGKKFRNFAQGLTFEMMVGHANRQLQKMTDRYLLLRDKTSALELNVIDNYQAGEIRSTKNLSGGESFIVSLSLALGLSHMASQNVRVDSLFLDEGFGTLDEDALDTALSTLAGLQQEGKLIGVISHVPALKERLGTQIRISPINGGKSQIAGPGCRRITEHQLS